MREDGEEHYGGISRLARLTVSMVVALGLLTAVCLYIFGPATTTVIVRTNPPAGSVATAPGPVIPVTVPVSKPKPKAKATSSAKKTATFATATAKPLAAPTQKLELVPVPANTRKMSILLRTRAVGDIPASGPVNVWAIDAPSNTMVQPLEPPGLNWMNTSVWPRASAYPSYPSAGTTYVYVHACWPIGSQCPWTAVKKTKSGYTVQKGDQVLIGTPTGVLTYTVTRIGEWPKHRVGSLPSWASDSTVKNRVVGVTCDERHILNGHARDNIIFAATLTAAVRR